MRHPRTRRPAVALALAALALAALPAVAGAQTATCAAPDHPGGDWPLQGHDLANTRSQPMEKVIGPAQARTLGPVWEVSSASVEAAGSFTSTPVIAEGCLFIGSTNGWVLALNADTGALVWKTKLPRAVNNSVTVDGGQVFALTGLRAAALDRATGAVLWESEFLDDQAGSETYGSPVVYTHRQAGLPPQRVLLAGISGGGAELGDEATRAKFRGRYALVDADTGAVLQNNFVIPEKDWSAGHAGAGVWATPAIDESTGFAYVGTGNPFQPEVEHELTNAIVKIDLNPTRETFGEIVESYKGTFDTFFPGMEEAPCVNIPGNPPPWYPQGLGACMDSDMDFGASPNLFRDASGKLLVGEGQKSGEYHVLDAETMKPRYISLAGPPSAVGGIVGSTAIDGDNVYGPITVGGYLWSIGQAEGNLRWASPTADGVHWGHAVSVANGVVYTNDLVGNLRAYDATTGVPLLATRQSNTPAADLGGGVSIARNTVYSMTGSRVVAHRPGAGRVPELPEPGGLPEAPVGYSVVAHPSSFATGYTTRVAPYRMGAEMTFVNGDAAPHDVVAYNTYGKDDQPWCEAYPAGRCPLFWTPLIGLGESTPIKGLDRLEAGKSYPFFCTIHPSMRGEITVLPA
jgi:polyvinyl alcohol dehydrogenase (cytochrome)